MSKFQIAIEKLQRQVVHTALDATIQITGESEHHVVKLTPVDLNALLDSARIKVASQTYKFLMKKSDYLALKLAPNRGLLITVLGQTYQTVLGNKGVLVDNDGHQGFVVISANHISAL